MEQKKTLWIIAASGLFLLAVIGAALLLNSPSSNVPATASITTIDKTPVVITTTETPSVTPVVTPLPEQALDSNTLAFQQVEEGNSAEPIQPADTNTTNIELKTSPAPSANVTATSRAGQEALANASSPKQEAATIYTAAPSTPKPAKTVASAPAKSTSKPVAKPSAPVSSKYWVQAASFTNKKSADNARSALDENKIPAEVFTYKDGKDTLFYRVRVGPYTTKSEAEYWKSRICKIDLFKNTQSYVTEVKM